MASVELPVKTLREQAEARVQEFDLPGGGTMTSTPPGLSPVEKAAPIVGQIADAVATIAVLRQGGHEANPVMRPIAKSEPALLIVKAAVGVVFAASGEVLTRHGHRRLGRAVSWFGAAIGLGAAIHNVRELD
jgi:hypothetical protein